MYGRIALYSALLLGVCSLIATVAIVRLGPIVFDGLPAQSFLPSDVSAHAWAVFDPDTGTVLAGKNVEVVLPIASITKLFTAYAIMESGLKNDAFTILASDVATEGRAGKLASGVRMTPYELLFPLLLESSNDAGVALERRLGDELAGSNTRIKETLELSHTTLHDATGLDPRNVSTAEELARVYAYIQDTQPHVLDITELNMYINDHNGYVNNDPARALPVFSGGKHGYIPEAGRTFVGSFEGEEGGRIGIVLLQSEDIMQDLKALLGGTPRFAAYF